MNIPQLIQLILANPIYETLKFLTLTSGNFGLGIILLTLLIRGLLVPLSLPMMRSQKKMRDLKPEIDKLTKKHAGDKEKLRAAQMELYKTHNINVLAGCLPQILQLIVLIVLYNVLRTFVGRMTGQGYAVNTMFLGLDLAKPDPTHIIPVIAAVSQLFLSLMILPGKEQHDLIPSDVKSKKLKDLDKKETGNQEMAETMQKQMVFMMPLMTGWLALSFPAGLGVYWVATTIFTIAQQWSVSGPGGLLDAVKTVRAKITRSSN